MPLSDLMHKKILHFVRHALSAEAIYELTRVYSMNLCVYALCILSIAQLYV